MWNVSWNWCTSSGNVPLLPNFGKMCNDIMLIGLTLTFVFVGNDGKITGAIFIDFKKVFDTVNHQLLTHNYSFSVQVDQPLTCCFLSDRTQLVFIEQSKSPQVPCNIGVPQGSILGLLLFILFINELPSICQSAQTIMYADDTVVFLWDWDMDVINTTLSSDLTALHQRLHKKHPTLNLTKTGCMYFRSSHKRIPIHLQIKINDQPLEIVNTYKYLSDSDLTYKLCAEKMTKQIQQRHFVFQKIRSYLTQSLAHMYLNAVIIAMISYCLPIWCLTSKNILEPVEGLYQAFKIYGNSPYRSHRCQALEKVVLSFEYYCKLNLIKPYHQIQFNLMPALMNELMPRHNSTRQEQSTCSISNCKKSAAYIQKWLWS